jgi:VWFA-related protein
MIGFQGESFMPTLRSVVRVVLLSSLATGLSLSLTSQNATPTTTLRVTSNLVFLDVTVVDRKGQPVVSGLTKDNFTIMENGKPQRIFSFDAPAASEKTRETASTNTTILVLDLLNTPTGDSANARDGIRQFLLLQAERLPSQTELMVLNNTALNLAAAYTHNRNKLLSALEQVRPETPYKLRGGDWADERLAQSIEALQQIALQNRGSPGRKNILWVGQGGPNIKMDPADPSYDRHVGFFAHGTTNMLVDARISLFLVHPGGVKGAGNPDLSRIEVREVAKQKDLEDFDPFAKTVNFGLFIKGTGGKFFDNRNDVVRAIAEAQDLGSNYYTLTYQPQAVEKDGKFRKIEVVMRERNLRAMTKTGYYAPEPTSKSGPTQNHVDPAIEIDEAAQSGFLIDSLGMSLVNVERHPDSQTVEVKTLLKSTHLRWQSTDDGRSTSDITVEAVSLSKKREIGIADAAALHFLRQSGSREAGSVGDPSNIHRARATPHRGSAPDHPGTRWRADRDTGAGARSFGERTGKPVTQYPNFSPGPQGHHSRISERYRWSTRDSSNSTAEPSCPHGLKNGIIGNLARGEVYCTCKC